MVYAIERVIKKEKLEAKMEGIIEGEMKDKMEIIREMLKEGDSFEKISRVTKLSIDEFEKIAKTFVNLLEIIVFSFTKIIHFHLKKSVSC